MLLPGGQGVAGSNPVSPTTHTPLDTGIQGTDWHERQRCNHAGPHPGPHPAIAQRDFPLNEQVQQGTLSVMLWARNVGTGFFESVPPLPPPLPKEIP